MAAVKQSRLGVRAAVGWAAVALLMLGFAAFMALQLPADWAHHEGRSLPGTAKVVTVEPFRGGDVAEYEVWSATGAVLGVLDDVYGADAERVGQQYPVNYVLQDGVLVAGYASGEDPFAVNAWIAGASAVGGAAVFTTLGWLWWGSGAAGRKVAGSKIYEAGRLSRRRRLSRGGLP